MRDAPVHGLSHPAYKGVVDAVSAEVAARASKDMVRRGGSAPVVMTQILVPSLAQSLEKDFPECRIINYGMDMLVHGYFQAYAQMMNELMLLQASHMASTAIHLGGSLLSSLLVPDLLVHHESDMTIPRMVHERHRDARNTNRVMGDYAALAAEGSFEHARKRYDDYTSGSDFVLCASYLCTRQADVYCVDAARHAISPTQLVAGAVQCGANVALAFFPYHPVMLLQKEGEIPGTGVYFVKDVDNGVLQLRYPEGVCGVETYSLNDWCAWMMEHTVTLGKGDGAIQYHFQLIKQRGPFMLVQATRAAVKLPKDFRLRHALDIEQTVPMYVVTGWRLKNLVGRVDDIESWEQYTFMSPKKVVDAVYTFGMQLSQENFSRYAIRRQLLMYDRVTIEGSVVTTGFRPSVEEVDALTTQLYSELFARRYESGLLSKEMMARLKAVSAFSSAGLSTRIKVVATWCLMNAWDKTMGVLVDVMMSFVNWLESRFQTSMDKVGGAEFLLAPSKLSFETVIDGWRKAGRSKYSQALHEISKFHKGNLMTVRGGLLAENVAHREHALVLRKTDAHFVHVGHVVVDDNPKSKSVAGILEPTREGDGLIDALSSQNAMDQAGVSRHDMPTEVYVREDDPDEQMRVDQDVDPAYIGTLNEVYEEFNPGMNASQLERDVASLSLDPQDRQLYAERLRMPRLATVTPRDREYYRSKVLALGAPKRQETGPELLSAIAARNLAPPKLNIPQDSSIIIPEIWDRFLDVMCVPDARDKLLKYQKDPVSLEENAYRDWMSQTNADTVKRVTKELDEIDIPLLERDVGRYLVMLKADVKPPLSDKPLKSRIEPQVIVFHNKALSSMYSSIFRVLVRRFLSLLKPNVHVNLLKDMTDIKGFLQAVHPFDDKLQYIENDFSKYDKSQDAFVFRLEQYVFKALGMNQAMLERWVVGHEDCSLMSFTTGISLNLRYQRKSGDATTSFGNVLLNILSVTYAYGIAEFAWALFMGDDSLMATSTVAVDEKAVALLAEVFNLTAKTYVTDQPYFASWFFLFDQERRRVIGLPDPIKRIEKFSQAISVTNPCWEERFISAAETCVAYQNKKNTKWLGAMVSKRYRLSVASADRLASAVYTACMSTENFRAMYEDEPEFFLV